jgi:hypothetical protein
MRTNLVLEMDRPFGVYEIEDGEPHWRKERDQTFREMEGKYPFIGPLRELRYSLSKLRLNDLPPRFASLHVGGGAGGAAWHPAPLVECATIERRPRQAVALHQGREA